MRKCCSFLVPICVDLDGVGRSSDWVLAEVVPDCGAETLDVARRFCVEVADRFRRPSLGASVGEKLCAIFGGPRVLLQSVPVRYEAVACPDCDNALDSVLVVFGLS